jgi:hypothetical protein
LFLLYEPYSTMINIYFKQLSEYKDPD